MKRIVLLALLALPVSFEASAQTFTQTIGGGAAQVRIGDDQRLMFEAAQNVMKGDYKGAESLYSQAIAANGRNTEAYLQRAVVRRELGNASGAASDGGMVVGLSNQAIQANPRNALLYYQRGMGYRMQKDYVHAKQDLQAAIRMGGKPSWATDLKAIDLEQKAGQ